MLRWLLRLERHLKAWPQFAQLYGCSPVWIRSCAFLFERREKATWHPGNSQAYFFVDRFAPSVSPDAHPAPRFVSYKSFGNLRLLSACTTRIRMRTRFRSSLYWNHTRRYFRRTTLVRRFLRFAEEIQSYVAITFRSLTFSK